MSKLSREEARKQGKRLQSAPMLAPQTDDGVTEIVDCLMRHCQSAEHAESVMTQVLDNALKVEGPITAWIASTARRTQVSDQAPAGCDRCYLGPDINTGEVRWAYHVSLDGPCSRAGRCDCARGRWLASRDAERDPVTMEPRKRNSSEMQPSADWARKAAGDK